MPIRSGALLHVHYDPVRSVVIGYEFALNYCPDQDKGDHDLATIGPNRHINSQADSISLLSGTHSWHSSRAPNSVYFSSISISSSRAGSLF